MDACQINFAKRVEEGMVCDVLAGEQGPSCCKVEHIPDLKVIHVRFVKSCDLVMDEAQEESPFDDDYEPPAFGISDSKVSCPVIHLRQQFGASPLHYIYTAAGCMVI